MKFFACFDSPELKEKALEISKDLSIELFSYPESYQLKDFKDDPIYIKGIAETSSHSSINYTSLIGKIQKLAVNIFLYI